MIGSGGNLTRLEYGNVVNDQSRCRIVSDDIGPRHDRETHAEVDVTGRLPSMNNDSIGRHSPHPETAWHPFPSRTRCLS